MLARLLRRFADPALNREVEDLTIRLQEAQSTIRIQSLEIDLLADVIARDRKRVQAETATSARQIADSETGGR